MALFQKDFKIIFSFKKKLNFKILIKLFSIPEAANPTCPFCQMSFVPFLDLVDHLRFFSCPKVFDDEVTYFWKAGKQISVLK